VFIIVVPLVSEESDRFSRIEACFVIASFSSVVAFPTEIIEGRSRTVVTVSVDVPFTTTAEYVVVHVLYAVPLSDGAEVIMVGGIVDISVDCSATLNIDVPFM